ncbi:hypothetical protein ACFV5J_26165 [Streptomyces zaomyceticus]|uniref:hypothetical protein n=1 Tax=Streptomyces zaomyceticus TaxID=68286 RepID=UPI00364E872A
MNWSGESAAFTVRPARGAEADALMEVDAAADSCTTSKLFTSANVSNQPMQRLLRRAGWDSVGLVHGLDEGDPELFYLRRAPAG